MEQRKQKLAFLFVALFVQKTFGQQRRVCPQSLENFFALHEAAGGDV
jgi:hypothetical protein